MSQLTIQEDDGYIAYVLGATPTTGPFTVDFTYFRNIEVKVTYLAPGNVELPLTEGADYTLTGVPADDGYFGGTITMMSPKHDTTIFIRRVLTTVKETNFPITGAISIFTMNTLFSRLFSWVQDLKRQVSGADRPPPSYDMVVAGLGYVPANQAGDETGSWKVHGGLRSFDDLEVDGHAYLFGGSIATNLPAGQNDDNIATTKFVHDVVNLLGPGSVGAEPAITGGTTAQYWRGDKSWQTLDKTAVGLGNVANLAQVTSVTGTAPVVSSGGTTPAISMPVASGSVNGYLASADWTTFNGKAPLASPNFSGNPLTPNVAYPDGAGTTKVANTKYVADAVAAVSGGGPFLPTAGGTMTGTITGTFGTLAGASTPALNITQTWNNAATNFVGIQAAFTVTAAGASAYPVDISIDGHLGIRLDKFGTFYSWGSYFSGNSLNCQTGTAPGAAGTQAVLMSNVANFGIDYANGKPTGAQAKGSLALVNGASGQPYFNTDGTSGGWVEVGAAGGQVTATSSGFTPSTGADVVMVFGSVVAGNTGSWLNTSNGRYTPPAGKYFVQCQCGVQAPSGGNGTWSLGLRKNGTKLFSISGSGSASFAVPITVGAYMDATGTDFFDFVGNCAVASMTPTGAIFTAYRVGT